MPYIGIMQRKHEPIPGETKKYSQPDDYILTEPNQSKKEVEKTVENLKAQGLGIYKSKIIELFIPEDIYNQKYLNGIVLHEESEINALLKENVDYKQKKLISDEKSPTSFNQVSTTFSDTDKKQMTDIKQEDNQRNDPEIPGNPKK